MTLLIVLSSIFVYILAGAVVGQIWERFQRKTCNEYYHDCCDHFIASIFIGIFWPVAPILVLTIMAGIKLSAGIVNAIMGKEER